MTEMLVVVVFVFVVTLLLVFRYLLQMEDRARAERQVKPPAPAPAPDIPPLRLIAISPPADIGWSLQVAEAFLRTLLPVRTELGLRIFARERSVRWGIVTQETAVERISKAVYSFFPGAVLSVEPVAPVIWPKITPLHILREFFFPVLDPSIHRTLDPLTGLVGALGQLQKDEEVVYQLKLRPLNRGRVNRLFQLIAGNTYWDKPLQTMVSERMAGELIWAEALLVIRAFSGDRIQDIRTQMLQGLNVLRLEKPLVNRLVPASREAGYQPVLTPAELAVLWHLPSKEMATPGISRASGIATPLPAPLHDAASGVLIGNHSYQGQTNEVVLADDDRITPVHLIGATRMGKTATMHLMIDHDIRRGEGLMAIDPGGDLTRDIIERSVVPAGREADVVYIDLADFATPPALNFLYVPDGVPIEAGMTASRNVLKRIFPGQFTPRMEDTLENALLSLANYPGATIAHIQPLFANPLFRLKVLDRVENDTVLEWWRDTFDALSTTEQSNLTFPVLHRLRAFLRTQQVRNIVDQPTAIDIRSLMDQHKIVLVKAPVADLRLGDGVKVLGTLLMAQVQLCAMARYNLPPDQRVPFHLYVDEVQNFVNSALPDVMTQAAKYKLTLTIAHQYLDQIGADTLSAIINNAGTTIVFQVGPDDATKLAKTMGNTIEPEQLTMLDQHQAVVRMRRGTERLKGFAISTLPQPPLPENGPAEATRIIEASRTMMIERGWARPVEEIQKLRRPTVRPVDPDRFVLPAAYVDDAPESVVE